MMAIRKKKNNRYVLDLILAMIGTEIEIIFLCEPEKMRFCENMISKISQQQYFLSL